MHGGPPEALDFVRERQSQWQWWDDPTREPPPVSVVAVKPDDQWEAAKPERGVTIRVRCRWDSTTQGLPKIQRTELIRLTVDGREVTPTLFAPQAKWGAFQDHYHYYRIAEPTPGTHAATAKVRVLRTGVESSTRIEFTV